MLSPSTESLYVCVFHRFIIIIIIYLFLSYLNIFNIIAFQGLITFAQNNYHLPIGIEKAETR